MGEHEAPPKRWVIIKMLQHAIERTEAEIDELKAGRLFVRDASGPDDTHPPAAAPVTAPPPSAFFTPATPAGSPPAEDDKENP